MTMQEQQEFSEVSVPSLQQSSAHRPRLSRKQRAILEYVGKNSVITLAQATALVGGDIYANESKHVGALLSRMVERGQLVRIARGMFAGQPV